MKRRRDRLASRRRTLGLSQEALAERLGVERTTIARWESGDTQPLAWFRPRLAAVLKVSVDDLDAMIRNAEESPGTGDRDPSRLRVAICGSRAVGTDGVLIDATVAELARLVVAQNLEVNHGPIGVGIEVMTYVADQFRPSGFSMTAALFDHENVVRGAELFLVVGGGAGTAAEVTLARQVGKTIVPFPRTGGTASRCFDLMRVDPRHRGGLAESVLDEIGACENSAQYGMLVERIVSMKVGA
ncbi:helix-turn-helix transcriptional regulator [Promicromonospora soli]